MGPGTAALVDALEPFLLMCVASGGTLHEDVHEFFLHFFNEFPYDTGDVEGDNSLLKRMMYLARALGFPLASMRMNCKLHQQHSTAISYSEYQQFKPVAVESMSKNLYPFDKERFAPVRAEPVPRTEPQDTLRNHPILRRQGAE